MNHCIADTSVFVATESGRPLAEMPGLAAVSVVTVAELEVGVLRARDGSTRATRLATLGRVRGELPAVAISERIGSVFAALVAEMRENGVSPKLHDTWIAATALHLGVPVCTQDADFDRIPRVEVLRV